MREKSRIIEEYEVNPHTMMLQPMEYGARTFTQIIEVDDVLVSPFKPFEILRKAVNSLAVLMKEERKEPKNLRVSCTKPPLLLTLICLSFYFRHLLL